MKPSSLLVFADDWGRHPSSCQHLIRRLLDRRPTIWVNTIGMRPPRFDLLTLKRGLGKIRQWLRPAHSHPGADAPGSPAGPRVLNPRMWPWLRSPFDRRLNRMLLLRQLTPVLESLPAPPIAVTTLPIVADLMGRLPVQRWVYYCVDDFAEWPGLDRRPLQRMEAEVIARADRIVAVSESLQERICRLGRSADLLTHGVDLDFWVNASTQDAFPELASLERPLILFWGVIDRRMDADFLRRLAADLDWGTVVLVGPENNPDPALRRIPRLVQLPAQPFERLPALAREAAVLIMPYADLPVTRAMQPLKLKEYLATGKPVVVRDLPAAREWADCLDLCTSPAAFSAAVRARLRDGLPAAQRLARGRLAEESWDEKARTFERLVLETIPDAVACC
ncbi:MAG TPA: glycosyltransferase [Gemmataceae bacterium]|nr:glycosyltransferase [Gemmataceae bacterium]